MNDTALLPIKQGDNFALGPYHFVCMGWKNGRIQAMRHEEGRGFFMYSISPFVILEGTGFRMLSRAREDY